MTEKTFNKIFSAFILVGTAVSVILATVIKTIRNDADVDALLVISAFGSVMGVLSTVSAANGKIITFLFGLIDVSIYGVMCFLGENYGNAALHVLYFVPMQIIGFAQWKKRGAAAKKEVKARRLSVKQWILVLSIFLAGTAISYLILDKFNDDPAATFIKMAVLTDAMAMMCNIIGQFLMSTAYADQWFFWIGVNISSITMWSVAAADQASSGHGFAAIYIIKYSFYLINALNGLRIWLKLSR